MIDDNNEQQADSVGVTIDVQTGERSDEQQAPPFSIVEHTDGKRYIRADQLHDYKAHRDNEYKTIQSELDSVLSEIDAIDQLNAIEDRQKLLSEFVEKNGDDYDMSEFIDFGNEEEFNEFMTYLETVKGRTYADPSAGFGPSKQPQSNTPKMQYEAGRQMARQMFEGRR